MSDTTFSIHDELSGSIKEKKNPTRSLTIKEQNQMFLSREVWLLFTESDDDITCKIDKTTKFHMPILM